MTMRSLFDAFKVRRLLKSGWRLQRSGNLEALAALAEDHSGTPSYQPLRAMLAKGLAEDDERQAAREAFNALYAALKGSDGPRDRYLKIYALYNLALIRNSLPDAAHCARKARKLEGVGFLRAVLPAPMVVVPPEAGPAITAMM